MVNKKDKKQPLYMISVVSEMLGVHPQTLRMYEREGLITPRRMKRLRLYSEDDVEKLHLILSLTREMGVNKAGVDIILRMRHRLEALHREVEEMMPALDKNMRDDFEERIKRLFSANGSYKEED
ncbi:MAG: MerR family transcriptional regulator [Thermodesulfovibrionales bacterium]|nr:MerR family transcriptional regulator [Thermodesulfovibrionales bacterium]